MTSNTADMSSFRAALQLYDTWGFKAFVFVTTLVTSTAVALVLDVRLGLPPATVLLYLVPVMVVLIIVESALFLVFRSRKPAWVGTFDKASQDLLDSTASLIFENRYRFPEPRYGNVVAGGDVKSRDTTDIAIKYAEEEVLRLRQKLEELLEEIESKNQEASALLEEEKTAFKRVRPYTLYGGRCGPFKTTRRVFEIHKRA